MDIRKVKKLIELLDESGIAEIEITEGEGIGAHQSPCTGRSCCARGDGGPDRSGGSTATCARRRCRADRGTRSGAGHGLG